MKPEISDLFDDLNEAWQELEAALGATFSVSGSVTTKVKYYDSTVEVELRYRNKALTAHQLGSDAEPQRVCGMSLVYRYQLAGAVPNLIRQLRAAQQVQVESVAEAIDTLRSETGALTEKKS